jgi:hypothetical protein
VRGTGCRARRPCLLLPAWLPPLMMRAICYCSPLHPIPDRHCFTSRRYQRAGGFTGGHVPMPVYVWTAPGPDVRGGLSHILLRGPGGHLHLMHKALANGRLFFLLVAVLTVTRTRRKRN